MGAACSEPSVNPNGGLDWNTILNYMHPDAPIGAVVNMTEEERVSISKALNAALGEATYNADGTHTRNGITYDANGNDVNTTAAIVDRALAAALPATSATVQKARADLEAIRILHGVLDKLNLIPATGNEEYDEGFDEAISLLQQEVDYLEGHRTQSPLIP